MKVAILVCALVASALAAPPYTRKTKLDPKLAPQVQAAEQAWSAAEAERDAAKRAELWERAASAFGEVDGAPVDRKVKREAAYAAMLAWKNALAVDPRVKRVIANDRQHGAPVPRPLPERERQLDAALDRFVSYADPADPDVPGVLFLKATTYRRFDQLGLAVPIFRAIIDRYPRHEVAEYAANLLLDSYNRLGEHDQMLALVDELVADTAFMRDREDLARTIATIQRQAKRKHAETLERAAKAGKDWEQYVAAAKVYLDIYNADPKSPENDEVLYNAGVLFEEGRSISDAILAFTLMEKYYPNSKITMRAIARLGKLYGDIAWYDKAAAKLEEYAKKYAGEKDAYDAMSDAVFYRKGLGDRAKAIENTKYFIKTFGTKKPREAADAMWSLTSLYESDRDATLKHLREYLRRFGAKGGPDRIVIAYAKIGALLWKQSCPHATVDGLCVKVKARTPRTCGAGTISTMTATKRDDAKKKEAFVALAQAIKEFERKAGAFDDPATGYYYAQARLAKADDELETFLALAFPRGLSFDPANPAAQEKSLKRFASWLDEKQKRGAAAMRQYDVVLATRDAASSITAAARTATIAQAMASSLVTSELARDLRGPRAAEKRKVYCEKMIDTAAPLEARAVEAFGVCLMKSTELGWFSDSSVHCERQLGELAPDEFPRARERYAKPGFAAPVLAIEPPLR